MRLYCWFYSFRYSQCIEPQYTAHKLIWPSVNSTLPWRMKTPFNPQNNHFKNVVNETREESAGNGELHLVLWTRNICDYQYAHILNRRQKIPGPINVFNIKSVLDQKKLRPGIYYLCIKNQTLIETAFADLSRMNCSNQYTCESQNVLC